MSYGKHYESESYGRDCYINYVRSTCLAMERRLMDLEPRRAAVFWRWFDEEIAASKYRMKTCTAQVREIAPAKPRRLKGVSVPVRKGNKVNALDPEELS